MGIRKNLICIFKAVLLVEIMVLTKGGRTSLSLLEKLNFISFSCPNQEALALMKHSCHW